VRLKLREPNLPAGQASVASNGSQAGPQPVVSSGQGLPGLSAAKLLSYWQAKYPVVCQGPATAGRQLVWNCQLAADDGSAHMSMLVFATSGNSLTQMSIELQYFGDSGKGTADTWLRYAVAVPLAGVAPAETDAWLRKLGDGSGETSIGTVRFILKASDGTRALDIKPITPAR
jgi:hypothetical protein